MEDPFSVTFYYSVFFIISLFVLGRGRKSDVRGGADWAPAPNLDFPSEFVQRGRHTI